VASHELKTWPDSYAAVLTGEKTFEFRKDDRGFAVEDLLVLREYVPCSLCLATGRVPDPGSHGESDACSCLETSEPRGKYTGRTLLVRVGYIMRAKRCGPCPALPEGHVVMSIAKVRSQ
jgi:hypothetical protein